MDTRPVYRCQYRALLQQGNDNIEQLLQASAEKAKALILDQKLMTVALYRYGQQLFLYYEPIDQPLEPESFMSPLIPALHLWP